MYSLSTTSAQRVTVVKLCYVYAPRAEDRSHNRIHTTAVSSFLFCKAKVSYTHRQNRRASVSARHTHTHRTNEHQCSHLYVKSVHCILLKNLNMKFCLMFICILYVKMPRTVEQFGYETKTWRCMLISCSLVCPRNLDSSKVNVH